MPLIAEGNIITFLLMVILFIVSLFLILLILVQRGKGGGLTGALGGMGGQSAFGTKAGDVFTRLTIGTAIVWILLCLVTIQLTKTEEAISDNTPGIGAPDGDEEDSDDSDSDDSDSDDANGNGDSDTNGTGTTSGTKADDSGGKAEAED